MDRKKIIIETIDVLDNIEKAEISPFFKTRMNALLNKQSIQQETIFVKPFIIVVFASVLLLLNIALFTKATKSASRENLTYNTNNDQQNLQDYFINNSSNYYYDDNQ